MKKLLLMFVLIPSLLFGQITITNTGNSIKVVKSGSTVFSEHKSQAAFEVVGAMVYFKTGGSSIYNARYSEIDSPVTANISDLLDTLNSWSGAVSETELKFADGTELKQVDGKIRTSSMPYTYDIADGNISDHTALYKFGSNPDIGTAEETIWTNGGLYNWAGVDAAAGIVKISSTVENDSINGTGARTCTIYGLSSVDSTAINETVTLNGQTAVNSTLSYYRVNRIIVNTAGSGLKNEGIIYVGTGTVTTGTPAVKWASVAAGNNQTLMSVWTVPINKTFYLTSFNVTTNSNKGNIVNMYFRPAGELFQIKNRTFLFSSNNDYVFEFPLMIAGGTDIDCRAIATASGGGIAFSFEGWTE